MKRPTPWGPIMSIGAALLYGVSPIDLIPDLIPLFGLLDDVVVVPLVIILALVALKNRNRRPQAAPAYIDVPASPAIPEDYDRARRA
jgi:uncharacterized membrane protein YkvA (DUF1232 family)